MQNDRICPVCRQPIPPPAEAGQPAPPCPRCQARPRAMRRVVQAATLLVLLATTMGAAGVFALSDCPCSPFYRPVTPPQELQEEPKEPPPQPGGAGAKLMPPS
jgi:hypothetical protein